MVQEIATTEESAIKNPSVTETSPWSYKNPASLHISNDLK